MVLLLLLLLLTVLLLLLLLLLLLRLLLTLALLLAPSVVYRGGEPPWRKMDVFVQTWRHGRLHPNLDAGVLGRIR